MRTDMHAWACSGETLGLCFIFGQFTRILYKNRHFDGGCYKLLGFLPECFCVILYCEVFCILRSLVHGCLVLVALSRPEVMLK